MGGRSHFFTFQHKLESSIKFGLPARKCDKGKYQTTLKHALMSPLLSTFSFFLLSVLPVALKKIQFFPLNLNMFPNLLVWSYISWEIFFKYTCVKFSMIFKHNGISRMLWKNGTYIPDFVFYNDDIAPTVQRTQHRTRPCYFHKYGKAGEEEDIRHCSNANKCALFFGTFLTYFSFGRDMLKKCCGKKQRRLPCETHLLGSKPNWTQRDTVLSHA